MKLKKKQPQINQCPQCGSRGEIITCKEKLHHVCCHNPKCDLYTGYAKEKRIIWFLSKDRAIKYWNERA